MSQDPRKMIIDGTEKLITRDDVSPGKVYARFIGDTTFLHFGIGMEDGHIIDLNKDRGEKSIRRITFEEFSNGVDVYEVDDNTFGFDSMLRDGTHTIEIARHSLDISKMYCLLTFNCGMFVYHCKVKSSPSIERAHPFVGQYPPAKLIKK